MSISDIKKKLTLVFLISAAAIMLVSVAGYLSIVVKGSSRFIWTAENYPYLGMVYRLSGPNKYPTMMVSTTTFLVVFFAGVYRSGYLKKLIIAAIALLVIASFATFSKSILLFIMALSILLAKHYKLLNKITLIAIVVIFTLIITFFTHLIVVKKGSEQARVLKTTIYTSNKIVYQTHTLSFFEANYLTSKRMAIHIIGQHFFLGIGTGNFNSYIDNYKKSGYYPKKLPSFDPQCTYLRTFVEDGIFGAIVLLLIWGYVINLFIREQELLGDSFLFSLFLLLVVFLIEAIATDIMNFRHLWIWFAITIAYISKKNNSDSIVGIKK